MAITAIRTLSSSATLDRAITNALAITASAKSLKACAIPGRIAVLSWAARRSTAAMAQTCLR